MPLTPEQRNLVRIVTGLIAERGFVLAGAGALIEHGFVDRFTADIDLFTNVYKTSARPRLNLVHIWSPPSSMSSS